MNPFRTAAILLFVCCAATPAAIAADAPLTKLTAFRANYEVQLNNLPFKAHAEQSLTALGGDRWRLELRLESFLLDTVETSEFRWDGTACHTVPEHYAYTRKGIGKNRRLDLRFDFAKRLATRDNGKSVSTFIIGERAEDKLGHTLTLACRIARGARGAIAADVAWDDKVQHFDYRVGDAEETISTPSGTWRALRLERKRVDSERITTSWVAAAANWQAVKMQHNENGNLLQLRLLELDEAGRAAP